MNLTATTYNHRPCLGALGVKRFCLIYLALHFFRRHRKALAQSAAAKSAASTALYPSKVTLFALGSVISGRASPEKSRALLSWALRHEAAHPLAEHLLCLSPPRNKSEAASTLLAAVKTGRVATVRLVLDHIAVRNTFAPESPARCLIKPLIRLTTQRGITTGHPEP